MVSLYNFLPFFFIFSYSFTFISFQYFHIHPSKEWLESITNSKVIPVFNYTERIFTLLTGSTVLRFMVAGAPLAARRIRILQKNQMPDG
jgi:sterol desaturase/sphingolipid hydroxylase (fatty acid hydroxylase superfamily)